MKSFIAVTIVLALCAVESLAGGSYGSHSSYSAPSYSAPSYSAPSYSAPSYAAPVYPGPTHTYSYPSPAPHVKCGSNLLVGCHPNVNSVPCQSYQSYGGHGSSYGQHSSY